VYRPGCRERHQCFGLGRPEPRKRRSEPGRGLSVDRLEAPEPLRLHGIIGLAQQQVDVVGDPRLPRARGAIIGRDDGLDERLQREEARRRHDFRSRRAHTPLDLHESEQPFVREPREQGCRACTSAKGSERGAPGDTARCHV